MTKLRKASGMICFHNTFDDWKNVNFLHLWRVSPEKHFFVFIFRIKGCKLFFVVCRPWWASCRAKLATSKRCAPPCRRSSTAARTSWPSTFSWGSSCAPGQQQLGVQLRTAPATAHSWSALLSARGRMPRPASDTFSGLHYRYLTFL